jgi:CHAT domain-containing protein/Flp pilus assembly protein TadD
MGRYADAQPLFTRALAISETASGPSHPNTAMILNNLAILYESMGRYADAQPLFARALAISETASGPNHPSTAMFLNNLAGLYRVTGRKTEAEPLYNRVLAISEKTNGPDHPTTGRILNNIASLYESMGRHTEAQTFYIRALAISENTEGPNHPSVGIGLNNLALLYESIGQPGQAEPLLLRAWHIISNSGRPELVWTSQGNLLGFYTDTKPDLAIWYGKQAVNTLQQVRSSNTALDKETLKSFLQKNENSYKALADLLFAQGRLMEGQQVLAMLKEAEYFDFVQRSSAADPRKTQADYTEQERPWSERYSAISSQLASMSREFEALQKKDATGLSPTEAARMAKLDTDLSVARQAYDTFTVELLRELGKQGGKDASREREQEIGSKQLASLSTLHGTLETLGHGAVTLHYLMTDKRLWILLTTPTIQLKREAAISETELNRLIGQYRDAIANRDPNIKVLGKALYNILIAPVAKDLEQEKAQTLMLSLDGSLRYLPMAALYDGEKFLAQRFRLAIYTEAAKAKLENPPKAQWRFAGFGLTERRENFDALPSVRGELEGMVAPGFAGDIKFNQDFTAASFKAGLAKRPPVVHIASHFVFKSGTEADSYLLLGDGSKLSLQAIKEGNFRFIDVDLVTLSACETAVGGGKDANGREVEGFGALAQNQGAKGVIATLWPVADQSTGQFMQLFYGYRQQNPGMTKAQAMQMAQNAFIEGKVQTSLEQVRRGAQPVGGGNTKVAAVTTTDHPYYWAPFILMGNWL